MFLAKLKREDGIPHWVKQFDNIDVNELAVRPGGQVYVVGEGGSGEVDLGGGPVETKSRDAFIARYDVDGTHVWSRVFRADVGAQSGKSVSASPDGTAWFGADFEGMVDFGTGELTTEGGRDIAVTSYAP